jgi:hypothetical protein
MLNEIAHNRALRDADADLTNAIRSAESALAAAVDAVADVRGTFWRLLWLVHQRPGALVLLDDEGRAALERIRDDVTELWFMRVELRYFERETRSYQNYYKL